VAWNWTYNTNNELTGYDDVSYIYDNNGNMTQKTVAGVATKFFYNTEDRLSEVRDGSDALIASYYYDPFGRRLWKEVGGVRTYFHYSDEGLIGEYDSTGNEIKSYGYKPGSTWTTDPPFMKEGGNYYFYQNEHLGTPQKMTAVNGAVVWSAKYSSFGEAAVEVETVVNNLRLPGQYFDEETGLHYNYHRYYDPKTGRYLRSDPFGLTDSINLFIYALNNPIDLIDPLGLYCKIIFSNPVPGGDPLREWTTEEKIGYWDAVAQRLAVELFLSRLKVPVPNPSVYEYAIRYTTWQLLKLYVHYWEICYDDCAGEETSKTYIGKGATGKTEAVIVNQRDVKAKL